MLNHSTCPISFLSLAHFNVTEVVDIERSLQAQYASSVLVASVFLAVALFVLFLGAKLVKPTLFCTGFGVCFVAGLLGTDAVLAAAPGLSEFASCVLLGATPCVLGLLGGLVALCLLKVGFAVLGAGAGAGLGYTVYNVGLVRIVSTPAAGAPNYILIASLAVGGLLGALLLLKFQEKVLIVATASSGAAAATPSIFLLLAHANVQLADQKYAWAEAVATLVLFALGLAVQCRCAKKGKREEAAPRITPRDRLGTPLMNP